MCTTLLYSVLVLPLLVSCEDWRKKPQKNDVRDADIDVRLLFCVCNLSLAMCITKKEISDLTKHDNNNNQRCNCEGAV